MKPSLKKRIKNIPEDGWYKSSSRDTFIDIGEELLQKGFSEDEIIDILESCYYATADCFGG